MLERRRPALLTDYLTPERVAFVEWPGAAAAPRIGARTAWSWTLELRARWAATAGGIEASRRRSASSTALCACLGHDAVGFDTSMAVTCACVMPAGGGGLSARRRPAAARLLGPPAHSAELLPALAGLLERAGTGWDDVTAIAVGVGPGTFTGLRIGVATARGARPGAGGAAASGLLAGGAGRPGWPPRRRPDARCCR